MSVMGSQALFREIHKNTWLKRINGDNRKTTVINTKVSRLSMYCFNVFESHSANVHDLSASVTE